MAKYTEEQLIELRSTAVVPTRVDFEEFTKAIEEQRTLQEQHEDEPTNRRRSSHHGVRPILFGRKIKPREKVVPQADEDGWFSVSKKKNSVSGEEATAGRDDFREVTKSTTTKVRPNNKNISSSKPADARDITADKTKTTFNAFAALDSEDEDDE